MAVLREVFRRCLGRMRTRLTTKPSGPYLPGNAFSLISASRPVQNALDSSRPHRQASGYQLKIELVAGFWFGPEQVWVCAVGWRTLKCFGCREHLRIEAGFWGRRTYNPLRKYKKADS